jgi:predicted N-formylglutamate amidohydrolase
MPKSTDSESGYALLAADEPPPFVASGRDGRSNFVIVVDHASSRIPRRLGDLGLPPAELQRHIAWDIGALAVARRSIPVVGESIDIPGNIGLSADEVTARRREIFEPYHAHIRALLDERAAAGRLTILVAQHSMTNVFLSDWRRMHAAVLYNRDRRFAGLVLEALRADGEMHIADNEPYFVSDETDYTIPRHGEARGLPHVEIELRQDLVSDAAGQAAWARRITAALQEAERHFLAGGAR